MDARALRLVGGLLLVLALLLGLFAAPPTATGAADGLPAITQFKTAHATLALAMVRSTGPAGDFAYTGEGDIDNTRRAARFNVVFAGAAYEVVLVDGRLYSRDPDTGKWEWTESAGSGANATDLLGLGDPATADADWRRVGAEQIDGAATTHWRAVFDAEDVKRRAGADRGATVDPVEFTFDQSVDLWIGDANGYIYRYAVYLAMSDGRRSDPGAAGTTLNLTYRVEFSRHDQPLDIQPPAGAIPTADGRAAGRAGGLPPGFVDGGLARPLWIGSSREDDAGAPRAARTATTTAGRNRITYEPAPTRRAAAAVATATTVRTTTTTVSTTRSATPTATAAAALVAANPPGAAAPSVAGAEVTATAGKGPGPVAIGLFVALLLGAIGAFAAAFRLRTA